MAGFLSSTPFFGVTTGIVGIAASKAFPRTETVAALAGGVVSGLLVREEYGLSKKESFVLGALSALVAVFVRHRFPEMSDLGQFVVGSAAGGIMMLGIGEATDGRFLEA